MGRAFGIEIECWAPAGTQPVPFTETLLEENGISCSQRSYFQRRAHQNWSAKTDGSIGYDRGVEVVSPILKDQRGRDIVGRVLNLLHTAHYETNDRCGIHVHVDARDLSPAERAAVVWRYSEFESRIAANFPMHRQRNINYCAQISESERRSAWRFMTTGRTEYAYLGRKYRSVNLTRLSDLGTIEFRMHESTFDTDRVKAWIAFVVFFVNETVAKMRTPRGAVEAPMVEAELVNPYRRYTKNHDCFEAVRRGRTTAAELARLTGWEMATISSMMSDIRHRGFTVVREGRGVNATYHIPSRMVPAAVGSTTATQEELRGNLTDGMIEQALAWLGPVTVAA